MSVTLPNTYIPGQIVFLQDVISATSSLAADVTAGATTVTLAAAIGPNTSFVLEVDLERMTVTGGFGTTTLTVTRGASGTTAVAHSRGAAATAYFNDSTDAVTVYKPDGTTVSPAPTVANPSTGVYTAQVTVDGTLGWWTYVWRATGSGAGASRPGRFYVSPVP